MQVVVIIRLSCGSLKRLTLTRSALSKGAYEVVKEEVL